MDNKKAGIERPYTFSEFLNIIEAAAKDKKLDYIDNLDYFNCSDRQEHIETDDFDVRSDTHFGGSEGIYTSFTINTGTDIKCLAVMKTLGESDEDYIKMHVLAANICLLIKDYVRKHEDEFNWTGYNVSYVKDVRTIPNMWCGSLKNATRYAAELRNKGYDAVIRENATRQNISF